MANSQPISDLSAYGDAADFDNSDLFIVSAKKSGTDYKSYSITFGELYSVIKNRLSSELGKEWTNLPIVTTLSEARGKPHNDISSCLGPGVAQDLVALIDDKLAAYQPKWQA